MNVIHRCYKELFGLFGSSLFESPSVSGAPGAVVAALQQCHQSVAQDTQSFHGSVKVRGERVVHIPVGVMQMVAATCPEQLSGESTLFEPPESGLPAGLLASPCLLKVFRSTVWIPVVNVGTAEVLLYPRTSLGSLSVAQVVSLPAGVTKIESASATVSSQAVTPSVIDRWRHWTCMR